MTEFLSGPDREARVGDLSRHDADALATSLDELLPTVIGGSWYDSVGAPIDVATARLCLLRRARAGAEGSTAAGDDAVRAVLERADPEAVAWLLTRAISYLDEQGFPDFVPGARIPR